MISYLQGQVLSSDEKTLCILVGGVGYEINVNQRALSSFVPGQAASFLIHTHVREDQITLFGFETKEEKFIFLKLLDVSGIGPRGALSILSSHPPSSLSLIVRSNDASTLSQTPGIGKKTAEKILLELRGKLDGIVPGGDSSSEAEARLALEALGYSLKDIASALSSLDTTQKTSQEIIKKALKLLQQ